VFAGGTGFREINRALIKMTENVTRIVPIFDNGGSSKILREYFSIMSIGDIRNALITMASHEGEIRKVLKLFNWRLPIDDSTKSLKNELNSIIEGKHLLIRDVDPNLKCVISGYLRRFSDEISEKFDLKNGSIGNFILVGAYLSHNEDINSAIYVFRQLCGIKGNVLPVSLANNAHLGAEIRDNGSRKIFGQEMITNIDRSKFRNPIERVFLLENIKSNEEPIKVLELDANPLVIDEIKNSDLIVYGPGSFFSSIFPHFFINGIADEISLKEGISKVFIANLTESNETYNQSIEELLAKLSEIIESKSIVKKSLNKYITHILINRNVGSNFVYGSNRKYLPFGNLESFKKFGITIIERDLEDPWRRGYHDPIIVSNILASLCCS
jgi:CofD-related protein of GAK system